MRLTNKMRDDFVHDVMEHVPLKSTWEQKNIIAEIEKRLRATHPADLKAFIAKYPKQVNFTRVWVGWLSYSEMDERGQRFCHDARVGVVDGYDDLAAIETSDLKKLWQDWLDQRKDRLTMAKRVRAQTSAATTTQQLAMLFPDMTTLIPEDEVKKPKTALVAATGIVDELKALGMKVPV